MSGDTHSLAVLSDALLRELLGSVVTEIVRRDLTIYVRAEVAPGVVQPARLVDEHARFHAQPASVPAHTVSNAGAKGDQP